VVVVVVVVVVEVVVVATVVVVRRVVGTVDVGSGGAVGATVGGTVVVVGGSSPSFTARYNTSSTRTTRATAMMINGMVHAGWRGGGVGPASTISSRSRAITGAGWDSITWVGAGSSANRGVPQRWQKDASAGMAAWQRRQNTPPPSRGSGASGGRSVMRRS
jgi:hypothetical protein